jgi:cytoskeleton protein RodZ
LGLELRECAESLKISVAKVIALESGDDVPFASEIFIRGYLKNYAKLLNLSESEVIDCYDSQRQGDQEYKDRAIAQATQVSSKWWLPYLIGVVLVVAWFVVSNFLSLPGQLVPSAEQEKVSLKILTPLEIVVDSKAVKESLTVHSDDLNNLPQSLGEELKQDKLENVNSISTEKFDDRSARLDEAKETLAEPILTVTELTSVPVGVGQVDAKILQADEPLAALDVLDLPPQEPLTKVSADVFSSSDSLYFTFVDECWVEIIDASDETIMSSLRKGNSDLLVQGKAPFFIILGNVSGTTLRFNDEKIALDGSRDGRTLRLTVGG